MTSLEQRETMRTLLRAGKKCPTIAKELDISVHTVRKWKGLFKKKVFTLANGETFYGLFK